ncbi:hypothetical protein HYY75_12250 [bacterium]|nr:hypothetical protein [bacterium]
MSLTPTHFSDDIVFLKAQAQGNGFEKNLTCKVYSQTLPISSATSDPVPVASDSTASTSVRWFIEYLP